MSQVTVNTTSVTPVVIQNGSSLSAAVDLRGRGIFGLEMPAAWTTGDLTFQVSVDRGTTFNNLYGADGNEVVVKAAAARFIQLNPANFLAVQFIKIRSGLAADPKNQASERTIKLVTF